MFFFFSFVLIIIIFLSAPSSSLQPLYQNESIRRSCSNASSHDYAAVNGRSTTTTPRTPTTPTSPMHEGSRTTVVSRRPQNANGPRRSPVNSAEYSTIKSPTDGADIISQKLSMLDSLLDDLNSARRSYDRPDHTACNSASTLPSNRRSAHSPTNNGYASLHRHNRSPSPGMYNTPTYTYTFLLSCSFARVSLPVFAKLHN